MTPTHREPLLKESGAGLASNCRQYLRQLSNMGTLVGDFFLLLGRDYAANHLPAGVGPGEPRQCYGNAGTLAVERGWVYCEGYAMRPGLFPMQHAWCLDSEGRVVDPTWPYDSSNEYFGIALNESYLIDHCERTGHWGVFAHHLPPDVAKAPPNSYLHACWAPPATNQALFQDLIRQRLQPTRP